LTPQAGGGCRHRIGVITKDCARKGQGGGTSHSLPEPESGLPQARQHFVSGRPPQTSWLWTDAPGGPLPGFDVIGPARSLPDPGLRTPSASPVLDQWTPGRHPVRRGISSWPGWPPSRTSSPGQKDLSQPSRELPGLLVIFERSPAWTAAIRAQRLPDPKPPQARQSSLKARRNSGLSMSAMLERPDHQGPRNEEPTSFWGVAGH